MQNSLINSCLLIFGGAGGQGQQAMKVTHIHQHEFIRGRFLGIGKDLALLTWLVINTYLPIFPFLLISHLHTYINLFIKLSYSHFPLLHLSNLFQHSFLKQFYASVNELDYTTLRRGFINVSKLN